MRAPTGSQARLVEPSQPVGPPRDDERPTTSAPARSSAARTHLLLVVGVGVAGHAAGQVVPLDAAGAEALLARLECLDVVQDGEPARAEERQEAVQPALAQRRQLVARRQLPRRVQVVAAQRGDSGR